MEENENDNISAKDVIVLSIVATAVIIGVGGLAKLGYDLAGEGIRYVKTKRNLKK